MATKVRNTLPLVALIAAWIQSFKAFFAGGTGAAFTGTAPTTATTTAFTGTGYTTSGQTVVTTDNQTMSLNQCAGMWLVTATHAPVLITGNTAVTGAPASLTVFGAAPATTNEAYKILRAPTPAGAVASSAVHYDRGEWTVAAADASDLATSVTLTKALVESYNHHIADACAHATRDATNTLTCTKASVTNLATAILAANDLKAKYNAHRSQSGVHPNNDSGHATSSSDATDQGSLNTLVNEIKGDMNAHMADGLSLPSWRVVSF